MPTSNAAAELGRLLTGAEAAQIADRLSAGETLTMALRAIAAGRRPRTRELLESVLADLRGHAPGAIAMLRAIQGARTQLTSVQPVWTMPGHLAQIGALTGSVVHLVENARQSVTCSTFNFQRSSALWDALAQSAQRPEITVRVYLDATAAEQGSHRAVCWTPSSSAANPSTEEVAAHLRPATVLRSRPFDGIPVRNHAKFLAIDHRFLLVTSANFSWSAENGNVEFGVLHDNRNLAETVELEMRKAEDTLFERVTPASGRRPGDNS
ncbi:MAG: DISARM system phospholipase D-like protein DrmC [Streptosporangiaceae bacterium]